MGFVEFLEAATAKFKGMPSESVRITGQTISDKLISRMDEGVKQVRMEKYAGMQEILPYVNAIYVAALGEETPQTSISILSTEKFEQTRSEPCAAYYNSLANRIVMGNYTSYGEELLAIVFHELGHAVDAENGKPASEFTSEAFEAYLSLMSCKQRMSRKITKTKDANSELCELIIKEVSYVWIAFMRLRNGDLEKHDMGKVNYLLEFAKSEDPDVVVKSIRNREVDEMHAVTKEAVPRITLTEFHDTVENYVDAVDKTLQDAKRLKRRYRSGYTLTCAGEDEHSRSIARAYIDNAIFGQSLTGRDILIKAMRAANDAALTFYSNYLPQDYLTEKPCVISPSL